MRVDPRIALFEATEFALGEGVLEPAAVVEAKLRDYYEIAERDIARLLADGERIRAEWAAASANGWLIERARKPPEQLWRAVKEDPKRGRVSEESGTVAGVLRSTRLADASSAGREPATPRPEIVHGQLAG